MFSRPYIAYQRLAGSGGELKDGRPNIDRQRQLIARARRYVRYVSFTIIAILVLMMIGLRRMSIDSAHKVEEALAAKNAEKDPQTFRPLTNYFKGLSYLVSNKANAREYPGNASTFSTSRSAYESRPYSPYPDYTTAEYLQEHEPVKECFLFEKSTIRIPSVQVYDGVPSGIADAITGSYNELGMNEDVCFDRYGRFGPYGFGYTEAEGGIGLGIHGHHDSADKVWAATPRVNWTEVDWGAAQDRCVDVNRARFSKDSAPARRRKGLPVPRSAKTKTAVKRTVILFRTWHDHVYTPEAILHLRALITEVSLLSGGEYSVHLLVHVKDDNIPIWASQEVYDDTLAKAVPKEFRGMATLWSEKQMSLIYAGLELATFAGFAVHGVHRSSFMPVQYWAEQHPEYDFFWNWEMDVRHLGHFYEFFESISTWARKQPRKGLWERSSRFYVPEVHGSWQNFSDMVDLQTQRVALRNGHSSPYAGYVWGPLKFDGSDELDHKPDFHPPWPIEQDRNEWGVGDDADLITLNPVFDADNSGWVNANDVTGYNTSYPFPPRKASIIAVARISKGLLKTMHRETAIGRKSLFTEMWPITVALHHGFKLAYAPHPMYIDRAWPPAYLDKIFNGGDNLVPGGGRRCVFAEDAHHNLKGVSFYYNADFARKLWRRWFGYEIEGKGGEAYEMSDEAGGRMCLRSTLFHPIKDT